MKQYGGIEAGGTKFVCAIGSGPGDLRRTTFPTTTPAETIGRAIAFFDNEKIEAIGIASFGPLDLERGFITATPKAGWRNTDFLGPVAHALQVPIGFDTDVNAAALAESRWGAGQGLTDLIYITVGTGIGGGALVGGKPVHGRIHPEMGHVLIPRDPADSYPGCCPFHSDCLEGLASGTAMAGRWECKAQELPADHEAWRLEARYLAKGIVNFLLTLSPQRIILGGGVMHQAALFPLIRAEVARLINGYLPLGEDLIGPPQLGDNAGVLGAIALALQAANDHCISR